MFGELPPHYRLNSDIHIAVASYPGLLTLYSICHLQYFFIVVLQMGMYYDVDTTIRGTLKSI